MILETLKRSEDSNRFESFWTQANTCGVFIPPARFFLDRVRAAQGFFSACLGRKGNYVRVVDKEAETTFWVMRALPTDCEAPACATVCESMARALIRMLLLGGKDLDAALEQSNVLSEAGVHTEQLQLLFELHCIVLQGVLPARYFKRCYGRGHATRRVCTCGTFVQRGNCPHV